MSRVSLSQALRSLKLAGAPKQHGQPVNRNVSTALRPLTQDAPPSRVSRGQPLLAHLMRRYSSYSDITEQYEQDIALQEHFIPPSFPSKATGVPADRVVVLPGSTDNQTYTFGKIWLRDNCQCSKCIHPDTRQRIVDTFSIPWDIKVTNTSRTQDGVELKWSDGHDSKYSFTWLNLQSKWKRRKDKPRRTLYKLRPYWTYDPKRNGHPTVKYSDVMSDDESVLHWLQNIYDWGYCFVKDTPVDPESTEALLKRIAFVRHTHYGGFWDFTADMTFKDTAYTNESLGAHTDNTYFTDPARLQLFHLLSHSDGEGGKSLLVDGFEAARLLFHENEQHALTLTHAKHTYHASGNPDTCIQPIDQFPTLRTHPFSEAQLYQIRWNNYDRAVKWNWQFEDQEAWYKAANHFNEIIHRPELENWTQLEPGTALIFDNWRMLHGRSEFTGKRRMCGGYINNDDFLSRYRLLKFGREAVLQNIGNPIWSSNNPSCFL
ncbi:hypothetical protein BDV12DRAFT_163822 [Aspergillus spectabilis]